MSPEAQRIAIAESVGIRLHDGDHAPSNYTFVSDLPDYLNDLNAMHTAEKMLTEAQFGDYYFENLKIAKGISRYTINRSMVCATSKQRAEAYLKTIGKWEGADEQTSTTNVQKS